jgi:hypothetical protein
VKIIVYEILWNLPIMLQIPMVLLRKYYENTMAVYGPADYRSLHSQRSLWSLQVSWESHRVCWCLCCQVFIIFPKHLRNVLRMASVIWYLMMLVWVHGWEVFCIRERNCKGFLGHRLLSLLAMVCNWENLILHEELKDTFTANFTGNSGDEQVLVNASIKMLTASMF